MQPGPLRAAFVPRWAVSGTMAKDFLKDTRDDYDVIVIGSGLAGLTSANILARARPFRAAA